MDLPGADAQGPFLLQRNLPEETGPKYPSPQRCYGRRVLCQVKPSLHAFGGLGRKGQFFSEAQDLTPGCSEVTWKTLTVCSRDESEQFCSCQLSQDTEKSVWFPLFPLSHQQDLRCIRKLVKNEMSVGWGSQVPLRQHLSIPLPHPSGSYVMEKSSLAPVGGTERKRQLIPGMVNCGESLGLCQGFVL